jgi:superfamily II DNA or RNA helicase
MGTIAIAGTAHVPFSVVDPRSNNKLSRAPAMHYSNIKDYVIKSGIELEDHVMDPIPSPELTVSKESELVLRDYQKKALSNWGRAGMRGCVVLPTGSGKTLVGVKAIEKVNAASLIVVPTIDLMDQWRTVLSKHFRNVKVGMLGGGEDDIQPITVATYDSAYIRAPILGNRFSLVVFDEVHHLAAPGYRTIAEQFASPYRLGLTATIEREDQMHKDIPSLVGGVVFEAYPEELANKKHLAPYEIERRRVEMLPSEVQEYNRQFGLYQVGLKKLGLRMNYPGSFQRLIMMAGRSPAAREAMLARNRAMDVALNSRAKLDELKEILSEHRGAKTLIFTQHNKLVHDISGMFFIPSITHRTGKEERQDVLAGFKEGRYIAIVTSKVLDEGVDVPDAELGVILSGTGSSREFIQRLGRLLRPKPEEGKKAKLVEIVSSDTREIGTSAKRKRAMIDARSRSSGRKGRMMVD